MPAASMRPSDLAAGIGASFKAAHMTSILEDAGSVGFFEVHAENYMGAGGPPHARLERLRRDYPVSVHGVGLSIGGPGPLDAAHLGRLKDLLERYQPILFSEHLAWSTHGGGYYNDLLALPYTDETLAAVCAHIDRTQAYLGRRMLLENPSTYVSFEESTWDEPAFIAEVQKRTGCGLLLDVGNVYVSATNHGWNLTDYITRFPLAAVEQIHLAGHTETEDAAGNRLLIDTHDRTVADAVTALYARIVEMVGPLPTLVEWDADVPDWPVLQAEAESAAAVMRVAAATRRTRHVA